MSARTRWGAPRDFSRVSFSPSTPTGSCWLWLSRRDEAPLRWIRAQGVETISVLPEYDSPSGVRRLAHLMRALN